MQRKAALVGANVERFALCVLRCSSIVFALVQERSGLLAAQAS